MNARHSWTGIVLLALIGPACPAQSPSTAALQFDCATDADCLPGSSCLGGRCVATGSDAGIVVTDAAVGADAAARDALRADAVAADAALRDVVASDRSDDDAAATDAVSADRASSDLAGIDAPPPDTAAGDAAVADAAPSDLATADLSPPDVAVADLAQPDTASADLAVPDVQRPDVQPADTSPEDLGGEDAQAPDRHVPDLGGVDACTPTGPEATSQHNCEDGADNDCDGWADEHDDDCWWDQAWSRRRKLNFINAGRSSALDDFPVLLVLSSDRLDFAQVDDAGADLRFVAADDQTVLAHEIDTYQEPDPGLVWVRVPHIAAGSDADFIWMYYGSAAADGQQRSQVWSNSFQGVYHLAGNLTDSSASGFDATNHGSSNQASGQIGQARGFNGSNQWLDLGANRNWLRATGAATLSGWIRPTSSTGDRSILAISIHNGSTPTGTSRAYIEVADGYVAIGGRGSDSDSERRLVSDNSALTTGAWHHVVGLLDYANSWGTIYVDGRKIDEGALSFDRTSTADTTATCGAIGAQDDGTTYYFAGSIDELRVATHLRSADWVDAEYQSQRDNGFVHYGVEQVH